MAEVTDLGDQFGVLITQFPIELAENENASGAPCRADHQRTTSAGAATRLMTVPPKQQM